jgi:septin 7
MADSYSSSRNGDISPNPNGIANGSNPVLAGHNSGVSSVIRKKLMGYVGFANLPNQVHRKSVRKGFQFTAMVVGMFPISSANCQLHLLIFSGESGLGKSTLINTLFNTTLYPPKVPLPPSAERPSTVAIESIGAGASRHSSSYIPFFEPCAVLLRYRGKWCAATSNRRRYSWFW